MNRAEQHQAPFQTLYYQLLVQYSSLAQNYHNQSEQNIKLYQRLQGLLQEKLSLTEQDIRTQTSIPITPQPPEDSISRQLKQAINYQQQKTIKKKAKAKRENRVYRCPYELCPLIYRSSVSMNLHIKLKHRGGTKKQRESLAKLLIEAEQRGLPYPQIDLDLPPNFIEEFKKNYEYAKKYNM